MKLNTILGLIALVTVLATGVCAQGLSQALPYNYSAVPILGENTIEASHSVTSSAISDPAEILSVEYDSTPTVGVSGLSISVIYSNEKDGTYVTPVNGDSSVVTSSITFGVTPTSGVDFHGYPAKFAKFVFANNGAVSVPLLRVTGMRRAIRAFARPVALVDYSVDLGLTDNVTTGATSDFSKMLTNPMEFVSFFWDTTGSTGTRTLKFYYSNVEAGPYVQYVDQGLVSVAYQNQTATTAKQALITAKPFPALYMKVKYTNGSAAPLAITQLLGVRRGQDRR